MHALQQTVYECKNYEFFFFQENDEDSDDSDEYDPLRGEPLTQSRL